MANVLTCSSSYKAILDTTSMVANQQYIETAADQVVGSNSGIITYSGCDASDDTVLTTIDSQLASITHDDAFAAGWKLVGPGCSVGSNAQTCYLFHK